MIKKEHPNLIFLDLHLPGKSGYEISRDIEQDPSLKDIYVIILTSSILGEDPFTEKKLFAHEFITKPFDPKSLLEKVHKLLDG